MAKSKYSPEFRAKLCQAYIDGKGSMNSIAQSFGIDRSTFKSWLDVFHIHGIHAFISSSGNKSYTKEFKLYCVKEVTKGNNSINGIAARENVARSILREWVRLYNANIELRDYTPKREVYMAEARRKTTIEERKEIVKYCINNNRNYKDTAALYDVSYGQVYSWVKKYDANGEGALIDKRGIHKTDDEVDELERLRRENLRLKRQLKEKDMLTELLKKVREYEGM